MKPYAIKATHTMIPSKKYQHLVEETSLLQATKKGSKEADEWMEEAKKGKIMRIC